MSGQHTPGPWAQHPSYPWIIKQDYGPLFEIEDGVTVCNTTAHERSGFFPSPDEGRANARLIAAAPDMLQALRRAALALAFAAETSPAMRDDYEAVSAAIAKATQTGGGHAE